MRTISSPLTLLVKIVTPLLWIVGSLDLLFKTGVGTVHSPQAAIPRPIVPIEMLVPLLVAGMVFILWVVGRLKWVRLDEGSLHISSLTKEIVVPLRKIADVTQSRWNPGEVTIHLYDFTEFGRKITFMPTFWIGAMFARPHPIVKELKDLARSP